MQVYELLIVGRGGKHNKQCCKQCHSNDYQSTYLRQLISIAMCIVLGIK